MICSINTGDQKQCMNDIAWAEIGNNSEGIFLNFILGKFFPEDHTLVLDSINLY